MLSRLARTSYRRRRLVLAAWIGVMILMVTAGSSLAGSWATNGRLPGTDSQHARDLAAREFPQRSGDSGQLVFADINGHRPAIDAYIDQVAHVPGVAEVDPLHVSSNTTVAVAPFTFADADRAATTATATRIQDLARPLRDTGVQVEFGGGWFQKDEMPASEAIGLLAAVVILLIAFGSVVAMGLPIVTALVGIAIAVAGVGVIANLVST